MHKRNFCRSLPLRSLPPSQLYIPLPLSPSLPLSNHPSPFLPPSLPPSHPPSLPPSLSPFRYDVELFQRIEQLIGKRLPLYLTVEEEVMALMERVSEAQRHAKMVRYGETVCEREVTSCQWSSIGLLHRSFKAVWRTRSGRESLEKRMKRKREKRN